jgi:hypothetical protein
MGNYLAFGLLQVIEFRGEWLLSIFPGLRPRLHLMLGLSVLGIALFLFQVRCVIPVFNRAFFIG